MTAKSVGCMRYSGGITVNPLLESTTRLGRSSSLDGSIHDPELPCVQHCR